MFFEYIRHVLYPPVESNLIYLVCQNKKDTDLKKKKGYKTRNRKIVFPKGDYSFKLHQVIYRGTDLFY